MKKTREYYEALLDFGFAKGEKLTKAEEMGLKETQTSQKLALGFTEGLMTSPIWKLL